MSKPSELLLRKHGLSTWSHVSEDTRLNLSQVPWIKEKVGSQDKGTNELKDVGIWATGDSRYTASPKPIASGTDSDTDNIELEGGVPVPEFSLRIVDENDQTQRRPISEVLRDVRRSFGAYKNGTTRRPRGSTTTSTEGGLDQKTPSRLRESITAPTSQGDGEGSAAPRVPPSNSFPNPRSTPQNDKKSNIKHANTAKAKQSRQSSWIQHYLTRNTQRQDSTDSLNCQLQLFPAEIATEENWKNIQQRLPESIREQCTFREEFWWYDGDPSELCGLSRDNSVAGSRAGSKDSRQSSHPVIQKGSITIAGRSLLIERCFRDASTSTWTCRPDDIMMADNPIPGYKDGKTVVVPLASLSVRDGFVWTADPLGQTKIHPRNYSEEDLKEIARYVSPHEFFLYLDGTLQVMLSMKQLKRLKSFPRTIGGLSVSFSSGTVRHGADPKVVDAPASGRGWTSKLSLNQRQTGSGNQSIRKSIDGSGRDIMHSAKTLPKKSSPANTNVQKFESKTNGEVKKSHPQPNDRKATANGNQEQVVPQSSDQNGSAVGPNSRPESPDGARGVADHGDPALAVAPPLSIPESPPPNPCEPFRVTIGQTIELGVSCVVGVKVRDDGVEKITVPTSAALKAARNARGNTRHRQRLRNRAMEGGELSVLGLQVWRTDTDPPRKIGKITRCFDASPGKPLTIHSIHPDDLPYDVCLVTAIDTNSFASITSPSREWWVKAHMNEASGIVQDTVLHIVCPENRRQEAYAIDGTELQALPAVTQGIRVVTRRKMFSMSTLYRFLGPVESWHDFRGAPVVEVNQATNTWDSVVGLHSFEYLVDIEGHREGDMTWKQIKTGLEKGTMSFWGCRHLPDDLLDMQLVHS